MNKSVFLSLDIDFFNPLSIHHRERRITRFLNKLRCLAPISAVMNHHQMLDKVNNFAGNTLFNLDSHSDLADKDVQDFNCGTWISYVKWRRKGKYIWGHNLGNPCDGCCNGGDKFIFGYHGVNKGLSDWNKLKTKRFDNLSFRLPAGIKEICICISPSYSDNDLIKIAKDWLRNNNIPFLRGRRNDNNFHKIWAAKNT